MKYLAVDAQHEKTTVIDVETAREALAYVGLPAGQTDDAMIFRDHESGLGAGIIVYEFGLFEPADEQHYFFIQVYAVDNRLYAGNAVIYAFDAIGDTVDMPDKPLPIKFMHSSAVVEQAIAVGLVRRPRIGFNDKAEWLWPMPPPDMFHARMRENGRPPR